MTKILLDMDGVLVDFMSGICKHHGRENPYEHGQNLGVWDVAKYWDMHHIDFWDGVSKEFWNNLTSTQECYALLRFCESKVGDRISILTAPPEKNPIDCANSVEGKLCWLGFRNIKYNVIFTTDKSFCANPKHILIDDADHNVDAFRAAGGKAILIPRPWNSLHDSKLSVMEHVSREWDRIHESERDSGSIGAVNTIKGWVQMCLPLS